MDRAEYRAVAAEDEVGAQPLKPLRCTTVMRKRIATSSSENTSLGKGLDESDDYREALSEEVLEAIWQRLENVQLDARQRQFIWPDQKALTFKSSAQRLQKEFPTFPRELIETHLIGWIEMEYVPQGCSEKELNEFERLTEKWVDALDDQLETRSENLSRTRHS